MAVHNFVVAETLLYWMHLIEFKRNTINSHTCGQSFQSASLLKFRTLITAPFDSTLHKKSPKSTTIQGLHNQFCLKISLSNLHS